MDDSSKSFRGEVIVVDDEAELRDLLLEYLTKNGFQTRVADSSASLDQLMAVRPADLVLLDINLGPDDGLSIARRLRATHPSIGIIMLTAIADVVDRVIGLEVGADDYIGKPFDLRELRARIRSVLRQRAPHSSGAEIGNIATNSKSVSFGLKKLDLERRCLIDGAGQEEKLTAMEFDLLQAFANSPNRVLTRDQLLDLAHQRSSSDPFDRSIDIRVARIRRKIEVHCAKPQIIKTVRGSGYMFVPPK
jgi:DNA-binding response OmpR family regulator